MSNISPQILLTGFAIVSLACFAPNLGRQGRVEDSRDMLTIYRYDKGEWGVFRLSENPSVIYNKNNINHEGVPFFYADYQRISNYRLDPEVMTRNKDGSAPLVVFVYCFYATKDNRDKGKKIISWRNYFGENQNELVTEGIQLIKGIKERNVRATTVDRHKFPLPGEASSQTVTDPTNEPSKTISDPRRK